MLNFLLAVLAQVGLRGAVWDSVFDCVGLCGLVGICGDVGICWGFVWLCLAVFGCVGLFGLVLKLFGPCVTVWG